MQLAMATGDAAGIAVGTVPLASGHVCWPDDSPVPFPHAFCEAVSLDHIIKRKEYSQS